MMAFSTLCLNFLRWSFLNSFLIHQVVSSRQYDRFEVDLISFSNPKNMTTSGKCCDGNKFGLSCPDACDTFFVVCILPKHSTYPNCILEGSSGIIVRASEFHSPINSSQPNRPNLVSITNIHDWKADFSLTVAFLDDDTPPGRTFNGSLSSPSDEILEYNHDPPITPGNDWSQRNYSKSGISFELRYRLKCGKNLYGSNCGVRCIPKDNRFGHTSCLPNGTKVCLPGFEGQKCDKARCSSGCGEYGDCVAPEKCNCHEGWTGPNCSQCITLHNCLHGTCVKPHQCSCKTNWTGQHCNVYNRYCLRYHPCKNNGKCYNDAARNFTCSCYNGFHGVRCEKCLPACNLTNANCVTGVGCSCHPGWQGPNCNQCIKNSTCIDGYCTKPFECICNNGWTGTSCNISKNATCFATCNQTRGFCNDKYGCSCYSGWQGPNCNQCMKNSTCVNGYCIKPFECICNNGWTGTSCNTSKNATCFATCNQTRGSCNEKYVCSCYPGWQGPNCNQCIKNSTCINGYCTKPFECICNNGWTGTSCNISKNATCFATCNQTGGFCNEKNGCSCYSGWQGPNCNQCMKNSKCINGYCTKPFECICNNGWTGESCSISTKSTCFATCNQTRGFCNEKNGCSCYSGWQGPNCNQCMKNSTCINGYCIEPFECICNNGWTGTSCKCSKEKNQSCEQQGLSASPNDFRTVAIAVPFGVLVCIILLFASYYVWRSFRRRGRFCVTSPEAFVNNAIKLSYNKRDDVKTIENLNNNIGGLSDLAKLPSTEIAMNPLAITGSAKPSPNLRYCEVYANDTRLSS